jgi:hypothetical protein
MIRWRWKIMLVVAIIRVIFKVARLGSGAIGPFCCGLWGTESIRAREIRILRNLVV